MSLPLPLEIGSYYDAKAFLRELRDGELHLQTRGINSRAHFRGEEDFAYSLRPKIARYGRSLSDLETIEPIMMNEFRDILISKGLYGHIQEGFLGYQFHEEWLLYQQAQHLGIATRFLDWTLKFEVALFFASHSLSLTNGKLYIYFPREEIFQADRAGDDYANFPPSQVSKPVFLNPSDLADNNSAMKFAQRFKARQHGRFLVTPLSNAMSDIKDELEQTSLFHTVTILQNAKADILKGIDADEAITQETLFLENNADAVNFKKEIARIVSQLHQKYLY